MSTPQGDHGDLLDCNINTGSSGSNSCSAGTVLTGGYCRDVNFASNDINVSFSKATGSDVINKVTCAPNTGVLNTSLRAVVICVSII